MYLAQTNINGMTHYYLRESFRDGGHFLSRDLIDLGTDPAEHIIYPGGNAFYYVIFNINQSFNESFAKKRPQYLKQSDVDDHFIEEICRLNRDLTFWAGMQTGSRLHEYLVRYILMYFDYDFVSRSWVEDYIHNFINSRRDYQSPFKTGSVTLDEASSIFGETKDALKTMRRQELVRIFRRRAQEFHPDKGGDQEKFVELNHAYHMLLRTKRE